MQIIDVEMTRLALAAPLLLAALTGTLGVRAAGLGSTPPATAVTAPRPVITVIPDQAPRAPAAPPSPTRRSAAAAQLPAADARGTGIPNALPAYAPQPADACESNAVPHPIGFTQMGGSGTDTVSDHGATTSYTVYQRHAPLQYVCTNALLGGGVEVDAVLQPVGADEDTFVFDMSPAGLTLVSLTPGRPAQGAQPIAVDRRIAAWPTTGCGSVSLPGIDDTFCFAADGTLRHVDLHEQNSFGAVSRSLSASLDDFPRG